MILDSAFLVYAIQQKMDQQKVQYRDGTRTEITILKRRLYDNEKMPRLSSLKIAR